MTLGKILDLDPGSLVSARELCHLACQWPSRAARANLSALDDDSHSNLGWNNAHQALLSHCLDVDGQWRLGFSFPARSLLWLTGEEVEDQLDLGNSDEASVAAWVDAHLGAAGLNPTAGVVMPYALSGPGDYLPFARLGAQSEALGAWYDQSHEALENLVRQHQGIAIRSPAVRCWPHHFDLATLFVLEEGDPETSRSIGVGFSPGDDTYPEPYYYCSPWPAPEAGNLRAPPDPLEWHTERFVSLVCRSSNLTPQSNLNDALSNAMVLVQQTL